MGSSNLLEYGGKKCEREGILAVFDLRVWACLWGLLRVSGGHESHHGLLASLDCTVTSTQEAIRGSRKRTGLEDRGPVFKSHSATSMTIGKS